MGDSGLEIGRRTHSAVILPPRRGSVLFGNLVFPRIEPHRPQLLEPPIAQRVRKFRPAPRAEPNTAGGRTAVVNEDAVLPEFRRILDEAVGASVTIRVLVA